MAGESEIAYAMHKLAADLHFRRRPTWDEVANHIAISRFPAEGLILNGNAVGEAVKRIMGHPEVETVEQWDSRILRGRPDLLVSYYWDNRCIVRPIEVYKVLFIDPVQQQMHPQTFTDYYEGLLAYGSPNYLHLFVKIQENTYPEGPTTLKDYPKNIMPSRVANHRKAITIRALKRIGL